MDMDNTTSGGPPSRPPPPSFQGPPPQYMGPQEATSPGAPPGGAPPPPYSGPPPGYYPPPPANEMGNPYPWGYQMPPNQVPQVCPQGGSPLYPDISALPQPQAGTVPFNSNPFTAQQHVPWPIHGTMYSYGMFPFEHAPSAPSPPPSYEEHISVGNHPHLQAAAMPMQSTAHSTFDFTYPCSSDLSSRGQWHPGGPQLQEEALIQPKAFTPNSSSSGVFDSKTNITRSSRSSIRQNDDKRKEKLPYGFGIGGAPQVPHDPSQVPPGVPPTGPSAVPVRPAPNPPGYNPSSGGPPSGQGEAPWWSKLKDLEAPPGCVISWKGGEGLKIYFLQQDGNIVSPKKPLEMALYKRINGKGSEVLESSLMGMVEVVGCWRLRLHGKNSFCLHSYQDIYVFLDDSTNPSKSGRIVIIELPEEVSRTMRGDLCALINEMTDLKEEQEGVVGKITTNVGSVYNDLTKKLNTAVKDAVPGAHKSTKWIRKGTGSLVRMGGNLVSKGMHIIADQMPASHTPEHEEESPVHSELMEGLLKFRKMVESGSITYV